MAALVAQLQDLKNDQVHMQELAEQVDRLRADNASLQRRSQTLPSLQAENERLKVGGGCVLLLKGCCACVQHACRRHTHLCSGRCWQLLSCHRRPPAWSANPSACLLPACPPERLLLRTCRPPCLVLRRLSSRTSSYRLRWPGCRSSRRR
jgi:hypothetical protein